MSMNVQERRSLIPALLAVFLVAPATTQAAPVLVENFVNVAALPGAGWAVVNNSTTGGSTGWFQGNTGVFPAADGTDDYIAANFLNAAPGGAISNWLILPALTLMNGDTLAFATRASGDLPDRLEVRFSPNGSSQNVGTTTPSVGDFSTLLLSINASLTNAYPTAWTTYLVPLSGLSGPTSGRLAFRYFVSNTSVAGDYIGIDSVVVNAVPEPLSLSLLGLGLFGVGARRYRHRAQIGQ